MATTFQLKRSSVEGKQPNVADLQVGELAVNLADGILYSKNTAGNIIVVGSSTTSNVTEGVNLYFTNTRAISAIETNELSSANIGNLKANFSLSLGNPDTTGYRFPLADGSAFQILQTDGSGQLNFVNLEQAQAGGFTNSTILEFPGSDGNIDYGESEAFVGESAGASSDAFGVSLGSVYDCMEPVGRMVNEDLEVLI